MSAVCGWISLEGRPAAALAVARMHKSLYCYGADRQDCFIAGAVAMAHCLLCTTHEDHWERQPLESRDGRYMMVADARIYNRKDLISELALGGAGTTLPDSAILLAAWERWKQGCFQRIEGDYAFAVWNRETRTLFLARDPFGNRALYWHAAKDYIAFASAPKALLTLPEIPRALNRRRVALYLAVVPNRTDETLFDRIHRVLPGHCLEYSNNGIVQRSVRRLDPDHRITLKSDQEYVEAFKEHFERAVSERLRSTGPVGSQLSSGFDSSCVTAVAARQLAANNKGLTAFTAVPRPGFDGPVPPHWSADEGPAASALARCFANIHHVRIAPDGCRLLDRLEETCIDMDSPILNACNHRWYLQILRDAQRRGINVLLTGQGGNATISYHGLSLLSSLITSGRWVQWLHEFRAARQNQGWSWKGLLAASFIRFIPKPVWVELIRRGKGLNRDLFHSTAMRREFAAAQNLDELISSARWDLTYRPWADGRAGRLGILDKQDTGQTLQFPTALGIEVRSPVLDFRLAQFCLSIPEDQYLRNGTNRWLLRRAMSNWLPAEIVNRNILKGYQSADWYEGIAECRDEIATWLERFQEVPTIREMLDLQRMGSALANLPTGGWDKGPVILTHRMMLLRGLSVGVFARYVEGNGH